MNGLDALLFCAYVAAHVAAAVWYVWTVGERAENARCLHPRQQSKSPTSQPGRPQ